MNVRCDSIKSSYHGKKLACYYWEPNGPPKALIYIAHGFSEHCMWFDHIAKMLVRENLFVFAHDHIGHGFSEENINSIDSYKYLCYDVMSHVSIVHGKFKDLPIFGIGHSMGGAVLTECLLMKPSLFLGVILLAPMFAINIHPVFIRAGTLIGSIFKGFTIPTSSNKSRLCRDFMIVQKYMDDNLITKQWKSLRVVVQLFELVRSIENKMINFKTPILIQHGTADRICTFEGSVKFHAHISSNDKTLIAYSDCYHQVHNEPEGVKEKCLTEIVDWIKTRLS